MQESTVHEHIRGQSDNTTGYLFYNPLARTVIPKNHIRFNEDVKFDREWTTEDEEMLVKEAIISDSTHSHPSGSLYSAAPPAAVAPPTTTMHPTTSSMSKQDDSDDENKPLEVTHSPSSQHDAPVTSTHNLSTPITKVKKVIDTSLHTTKSTRSGRAYVAHTQGALVTGEHYIRDETTPDSMDMFTIDPSMTPQDIDKWFTAIDAEVKSIMDRNVWTIIKASDKPKGKTLVNYKWVMKVKYDESDVIVKHKARLCAKGFTQKEGIDYKETFAPVARHATFKMLLSLGTVEHFKYKHVDIKTAFLYGELHEEVHMKMPPYVIKYMQDKHHQYMDVNIEDANEYVLQLNKALYGLKQAPRKWYAMNNGLHTKQIRCMCILQR